MPGIHQSTYEIKLLLTSNFYQDPPCNNPSLDVIAHNAFIQPFISPPVHSTFAVHNSTKIQGTIFQDFNFVFKNCLCKGLAIFSPIILQDSKIFRCVDRTIQEKRKFLLNDYMMRGCYY